MMATSPRTVRLSAAAVLALALCGTLGAAIFASDASIAVTRFQATVRTSTSLRLSDQLLVIAPRQTDDDEPLTAGAIEFRAAARTSSDGEVMLTVEPLAPIASLAGGAGDSSTTIAFMGDGEGAQSGSLSDAHPETAARWVGSGVRTGRLTFTVRGPVSPLGGTLPLRFLLTAP